MNNMETSNSIPNETVTMVTSIVREGQDDDDGNDDQLTSSEKWSANSEQNGQR